MATSSASRIIHHLRRVLPPVEGEPTDGQLLARYIERRDEAAFATLLERHGALVWNVCRRMLGQHDAEDAFQATFLVLCCKAVSIRRREMLASWLYGVAHQTALQAQRTAARRRVREKQVMDMPEPAVVQPDVWHELEPWLDHELSRLPPKHQVVILLCDLEGKSRKDAARQLGLPEGTVASRLARARAMLAKQLARHGFALPGAALAAVLARNAASAAAPVGVVASTVKAVSSIAAGPAATGAISVAVAALTQGTLKTMLLQKLKAAALVVVLLASLAAGAAGLLCPAAAEEQLPPPGVEPIAGRPDSTRARGADRADGQIKAGEELPREAVRRLGTVRFRHPGMVSTLALSANGKVLATGGQGAVVCLWDAQTGEPLRRLDPPRSWVNLLRRPLTWTQSLALSPDGRTVLESCDNGVLYLWDSQTGRPLRSLTGHRVMVRAARFSPDGATIASASDDKTVRLWQTATGKELRRFKGQRKHDVWTVAFTPDGKTLATGGNTGELFLYDVATGREIHRCGGHRSVVASVQFSPDGKILVSGSQDGTVRGWASATGRPLWQFAVRGEVWTVTFSTDGRSLAALTREHFVHVWDMTTLRETNRFKVEWTMQGSLLFAPDGKTLIAGDGCSISRWDVAKGKQLRPAREHRAVVMSLAFAPDGKTLASGGFDGNVCLWKPATGALIRRLAAHADAVRAVSFAPGGRVLASASSDGVVLLSDPSTGRTLRQLPGCAGSMLALCFTPEGKSLASGGRDGLVHSWDVATGRDSGPWRGQQDFVFGLAMSADGALLASAGRVPRHIPNRSSDLSITLWSVAERREIRHLAGSDDLGAVVFSPRGNVLVSRGHDGTVRVWETATGGERCRFAVPLPQTPAIAFSPDGRLLAAGCEDGTLRLMDLDAGKPCGRVRGPQGGIYSVAFSPDGRLLASGGADTTILLWDVARVSRSRQPPAVELPKAEVEALWTDLSSPSANRGCRALRRLAAAGKQAVLLVQQRVRPFAPNQRRIAQRIRELDDERFATREQASAELAALGELAMPALKEALDRKPALETALRIRRLLDKQEHGILSGEELRSLRVVELLEMIGTPDARRVLTALADGAAESRLSRECRAALKRLAGR